jgi:hypothetical protein
MFLSFLKSAYVLHAPDVFVGALIAIAVASLFTWIRDWREHLVALLPFVLIAPLIMRSIATIPVSEPHHPDAVMVAKFVGLVLAIAWMAISSKALRRWRKAEVPNSKWWAHLAVYLGCVALVTAIGAFIPLSTPLLVSDKALASTSAAGAVTTPETSEPTVIDLENGKTIRFDADWEQEEISRYLLLNFESSELVPSEDVARADEKRRELIKTLIEEAAAGSVSSQTMLAGVYATGRWVQADPFEATRLYRSAAAAGSVESQTELGYRLSEGIGASKDMKAAIEWTTKAANAGNAIAQRNLAAFYERGVGVLKDEEAAYFWYLLAAAAGDEEAATFRDHVEQRLSAEHRASAQQRARDWKPAPPEG